MFIETLWVPPTPSIFSLAGIILVLSVSFCSWPPWQDSQYNWTTKVNMSCLWFCFSHIYIAQSFCLSQIYSVCFGELDSICFKLKKCENLNLFVLKKYKRVKLINSIWAQWILLELYLFTLLPFLTWDHKFKKPVKGSIPACPTPGTPGPILLKLKKYEKLDLFVFQRYQKGQAYQLILIPKNTIGIVPFYFATFLLAQTLMKEIYQFKTHFSSWKKILYSLTKLLAKYLIASHKIFKFHPKPKINKCC